eukprot:scaffold12125_cov63-Phaeocystis_antarctica.AAC.3
MAASGPRGGYSRLGGQYGTRRVRGYEYELWLNASEYSRLSVSWRYGRQGWTYKFLLRNDLL